MKGASRFGSERYVVDTCSRGFHLNVKDLISFSDVTGVFQVMRKVSGEHCELCSAVVSYEVRRAFLDDDSSHSVRYFEKGNSEVDWRRIPSKRERLKRKRKMDAVAA